MSRLSLDLRRYLPVLCKRRHGKDYNAVPNTSDASVQACAECAQRCLSGTDDAYKSTDCSSSASASADTSGPEQSNSQLADSFDGSDTDNTEVMPNSEPTTGVSSEASDLESPALMRARDKLAWRRKGWEYTWQHRSTYLNEQVAPLAPTSSHSRLGEPIRAVIRALEQWEASSTAGAIHDDGRKDANEDLQSKTFAILQQTIASLSPEDAALVKSYVDFGLASQLRHCGS